MTLSEKRVWTLGHRFGFASGFRVGFIAASLCAIVGWILMFAVLRAR